MDRIKQAILDWIRDDAPTAIKLTITPDQVQKLRDKIVANMAFDTVRVPANVRQWTHYPIEVPLTADGQGPATVGQDAAKITYEVWDWTFATHGSHSNLPDAINQAIQLSVETLDTR